MIGERSGLCLLVPEIDSDGDVDRAHKAESNRLTLPGETLYAFSFLLVRLLGLTRRVTASSFRSWVS